MQKYEDKLIKIHLKETKKAFVAKMSYIYLYPFDMSIPPIEASEERRLLNPPNVLLDVCSSYSNCDQLVSIC